MNTETRVENYLRRLFDFWEHIPEIAAEFNFYDEADREEFFFDTYPLACDALSCLEKRRDTFSTQEEIRYQDLLTLIAKNQHYVDQVNLI